MIEEELLEPIARWFRFRKGLENMRNAKNSIIVDLGCGPKMRFYNFCTKNHLFFSQYIGVDPLLDNSVVSKSNSIDGISLVKAPLVQSIPLEDESADIVVGFAFLEHIDNPEKILNDSIRILKKGGKAIFTTPSTNAKRVLELLSFRLNLISKREILEHKNYFTKESLYDLINQKNRTNVEYFHEYFELGMNNLFVIRK